MKIDKHLKDLSNRLNVVAGTKVNDNQLIKDDEYYLNTESDPPRFLYYRHVRAKEWQKLGHEPWDGSNNDNYDRRITQDELDFMLKRDLRISPPRKISTRKKKLVFP